MAPVEPPIAITFLISQSCTVVFQIQRILDSGRQISQEALKSLPMAGLLLPGDFWQLRAKNLRA